MRTVISQLVAAGELSMGLTYRADIELKKDQGAPLEWVGIEPISQSINTIGIVTNAPHPYTAKLFVDFVLSREGAEAWASVYRDPIRPDVASLRLKKGTQFMTPDFGVIADHAKNTKLFREILMKK